MKTLVTGASGFIAQQLILDLLAAGHEVRGTVRDLAKGETLKRALADHSDRAEALELVEADLEADDGWNDAVAGVDVIHHVASPFPLATPKDPMELIRPAREGALRVLGAARSAGVERVILTSSFAAVGYGRRGPLGGPFTEADWTDPDVAEDCPPYQQSKTLAERAAWEFAEREGLALSVINPVAVFGPIRSAQVKTSVGIIAQLLEGKFPLVPNAGLQVVDVRDVSAAHLAAMDTPAAVGERYIVADDYYDLLALADVLREAFPQYAAKLPTRRMPDFLVRLLALFSADMKTIAKEVGRRREGRSEKVRA
ncbi:MAG: aldehyde reductase, partial [Pseudomonadales bacterium]|nr:aldehyde reductase [Pseudomonadales bacterium]